MNKIAVITDSNAGIKASPLYPNLFIVPMPFLIDDAEFFEDINLSQDEFYEKLKNDANISTSQPSFTEVTELWSKVLQDYDELIYIPMSSGLSSSCESASRYAEEDEFKGKVFVVNNQRISVTQKLSVLEALDMIKKEKSAQEIKDYLEKTKMDATIYIMVPTLKYLKKGGRVTPSAAALAKLFNIKPILQIHGEKLDSFAKVLNLNQAKQRMINAIKADISSFLATPYQQGKLCINIAHTQNEKEAQKFKEDVEKAFPDLPLRFVDPLSLSVSCHIGPGSLAVAVCRNDE
jgi:DegV family protein with EDD domain